MSDGEYRSCLLASIVKKTGKPFFFIFFSFTAGKTSATNFLLCVGSLLWEER